MAMTNAIRVGNDENSRYPKASKSYKWLNIIRPIWNRIKEQYIYIDILRKRKGMRERGLLLFRVILMHC